VLSFNHSSLYVLLVSLFISVWISIKIIIQKFLFIDLSVTNFLDIVCKCFEEKKLMIYLNDRAGHLF